MARTGIFNSVLLVGLLAGAAGMIAPRAIDSGRLLAAADDPARLSDLALAKVFDARTAAREIEAALAADDIELAESFVALAHERHVPLDSALEARVTAAGTRSAGIVRGVGHFARGFVTGEPDDLASLAGTATGDLFVFGDARDAVREGYRLARGEDADELILGLACVGLVITGATYATVGAGAPARLGLSVIKAARRGGQMSAKFSGALVRAVRGAVDQAALRQAVSRVSLLSPATAVRSLREAVKIEKAGGLVDLVRDLGRVRAKAGTRAALDGLKIADKPADAARLARLAEAKGLKMRAIVKVLGRGAIMLTSTLFNLSMWLFWAIVNLFWLCAAIKRTTERITLRLIRRRKARRAAMRQAGLAAAAAAGRA